MPSRLMSRMMPPLVGPISTYSMGLTGKRGLSLRSEVGGAPGHFGDCDSSIKSGLRPLEWNIGRAGARNLRLPDAQLYRRFGPAQRRSVNHCRRSLGVVISSALLVRSECNLAEPKRTGKVGVEFVAGLADDGE